MSAPLLTAGQGAGPGTNIQVRSQIEPWQDPDWQRLWLAVEARPWRSLALIPAGSGASPDFTLMVALTLSRTGMIHLGTALQVADATQVPLNQLTAFTNEVNRCISTGQRLLVALPPTSTSAITASIAQSVDAAVLCVLTGRMSSNDAKRTLRAVGSQRFLGSAIFHPHQIPTSAP